MEWLKTLLKAAGLDDSAIEKIISDAGKELPKHFIPKDKYNEAVEAKKQAEKTVTERDQQLEDLKKSNGDAEALSAQITKLQEENNTAKAKYEADLKDMRVTAVVERGLSEAKAKYPDLLIGKIDKSRIELLEDGTTKGLDDQIKSLKESYKDQFASEDNGGQFQFKGFKPAEAGSGSGSGGGKDTAAELGKKMAEFAKANNTAVDAQKHYFD